MEHQRRYLATMTAKGQLTVPAEFRHDLGLRRPRRMWVLLSQSGRRGPAIADHGDGRVPVEGVPMRADTYLALPEGSGYDLLGGLVFREPMPAVDHQVIVDNVVALLRRHARLTGSGRALREINVHLDAENVPAPDACFVCAERLKRLRRNGLHGVAPDLCVEVLSPSSLRRDRGEKAALYARFGCREYWIVDPQASRVEVLRIRSGARFMVEGAYGVDDAFASQAVPALCVDVAEVFLES